ncbi:TetR/AcrR family transcriptional regulator [Pandoraea anhela]|uniref:TetR family transcriptional regulator n=1 Tax=Pandoraea anhela TaxID=2508295 RepID=A0A5E4YLN0_9BURK|nr:TetR/AcrR family transcriptional regulator [Pandoraea anhela]VVE49659.1 TetR family transcriptional regulator [Pandoraea anhela]
MRYGADHKQKSYERILDEASQAIRLEGPHKVGVASVMRQAGLTHGAFYAHFSSRDALIEAAIAFMFEGSLSRWQRVTEGVPPQQGLAAFIDHYLSVERMDQRPLGCPMAALAADVPRMSPAVQTVFSAGVRTLTQAMAEKLKAIDITDPETTARSMMNELVGAISLARCEPDRARSLSMLEATRTKVKAQIGIGAPSRDNSSP